MVNVIAKRTVIRNKITDFGSTITIIPVTKTFDKWGDKTEVLSIPVSTVGIPYNDNMPLWMRNAFGDTPVKQSTMIIKDNETVNLGDIIIYSGVDYEVIKIEDFPLKDVVLAKQITLTQKMYNSNLDTTTGLVGFWKMTEGTGTTIADSSGLGNTGTFVDGVGTITWSTSVPQSGITGSLHFPDVVADQTCCVSCGDDTDFEFGANPFTLSAWINLSDIGAATGSNQVRDLISKSTALGQFEFDFYERAGYLALETSQDGQLDYNGVHMLVSKSTDTTITVNNWHHVICVKSGTDVTFYIDGKLQNDDGVLVHSTLKQGTAPFRIGSEGGISAAVGSMKGLITYVRVYKNRAFSSYEARALYLKDKGLI